MNVLELKSRYLRYMGEHSPIWAPRRSGKLIDSQSPYFYTFDASNNWFSRKLVKDPWSSESFSHCARCFSEQDTNDIHPPLFWMLAGVGWNMFDRRKAIRYNFGFLRESGLDPSRLKVTVWRGGKVTGVGLDASIDPERSFAGPEFDKFRHEGIEIPQDAESASAWEECGLRPNQIVRLGETDTLDPSGSRVIHLDARSSLAGIRNGIYYETNGRYVQIGETCADDFVKRTVFRKMHVAEAAIEGDSSSDAFLLKLKAKTITGALVVEKLAMVLGEYKDVLDVQPYRDLEEVLRGQGTRSASDMAKIDTAAAYVPAILWLANDGAGDGQHNSKARQAIYRNAIKTVIRNISGLRLDNDEIYLRLFKVAGDFYAQDDEYKSVAGVERTCLEEIRKQKNGMKGRS